MSYLTDQLQESSILIDFCWARGCQEQITLHQLNTSALCKQHEGELRDNLFGLPPKECELTGR